MKTAKELRSLRISTIVDVLTARNVDPNPDDSAYGHGARIEELAAAIVDRLHPPTWIQNPMESHELILTHTFRCEGTGDYYHVTLRGPFYDSERTARSLIADELVCASARTEADPESRLTKEAALLRLHGCHHTKVGRVHKISRITRERLGNTVEIRSEIVSGTEEETT